MINKRLQKEGLERIVEGGRGINGFFRIRQIAQKPGSKDFVSPTYSSRL